MAERCNAEITALAWARAHTGSVTRGGTKCTLDVAVDHAVDREMCQCAREVPRDPRNVLGHGKAETVGFTDGRHVRLFLTPLDFFRP